jgi:exonuclease III
MKYDIICFTETKTDDTDLMFIENIFDQLGYKIFSVNRAKLQRVRSGGIITAVKKSLLKYIKEVKNDCKFVQWLEVNKKLQNLDKNLIIGNVYIPPRSSVYSDIDMFDKLEWSLMEFGIDDNYFLLCEILTLTLEQELTF